MIKHLIFLYETVNPPKNVLESEKIFPVRILPVMKLCKFRLHLKHFSNHTSRTVSLCSIQLYVSLRFGTPCKLRTILRNNGPKNTKNTPDLALWVIQLLTSMRKLGKIRRSAKAKKNKFCNLAIDIDKENCYFDKLARNLIKLSMAVLFVCRALL